MSGANMVAISWPSSRLVFHSVWSDGLVFYFEANFDEMCCIHASNSLAQIEALEACLISFYQETAHRQCRNVLPGGEGMRHKDGKPRNPPPYFLYVVAANASKNKRIGT